MDTGRMDAVREGLARGLARFLAPLRLPDGFVPAFAETPRGTVFDIGANAEVVEVLAHPLLGGAEGVIEALLALTAEGPAPRAIGPARVRVEREPPRGLVIETPHHRFVADLSRGEVRQHLRGQEEGPAVVHGGNLVEFSYRGRWHCLDVEDAIVSTAVERCEGGVRLVHESLVSARGRFARGAPQPVARLRYAYEIRSDRPAIALAVTLTALPGVVLERVRITTACDAMDAFGTLLLGDRSIPSPNGENVLVHKGSIEAYGAVGREAPLRLGIRPGNPAALLNLKTTGPAEGRLHWLLARYATERLAAGASFSIAEERLLLHGLAAPLAAPRGANAAAAAPAAAIALALATAALSAPGPRAAALRDRAGALLAGFTPEGAAPLDIARALMAAEALAQAGAEQGRMAALRAALLAQQGPYGIFRAGSAGTVAGHAAALLALARQAVLAPCAAVAEALRRGVEGLALATLDGPVDTLALRGEGNPPAERSEDLARLLRALRAVQAARAAGAVPMAEGEARRLAFLAATATTLLQARLRPEGDALVVDGGPAAQAAVLAALLPPEGLLLRRAA